MPLTILPTELIEQIAVHSDLGSLRSLRLTCSSLTNQTFHIFKDRFFRKRTIKWTKENFDTLLNIAAHAELGNALQHLIIDATPWLSVRLWHARKRLSEAEAIFGPFPAPADSVLSIVEQKYLEDRKTATNIAAFFNETRYDQKCLKTIFARLSVLESVVFLYEGMDKKFGKFGRRYCEASQHEMSRPFVSTLAAIAASGIPVKVISTHHIHKYGAISIGRLESLAPSLRNFDHVFEKLEVLKLNLRDWRDPDTGFELDTNRAPFAIRFLAKAKNIKSLDLSCYSTLENDMLGEMARHCHFPCLQKCTLALLRINNANDLITLLEPSKYSLKSLCLSYILNQDRVSSWPALLRRLASTTTMLTVLEELQLVNLYSHVGRKLLYDEFGEKLKLSLGVEGNVGRWRKTLLERVDGFALGSPGPAWHLASSVYPFLGLRT